MEFSFAVLQMALPLPADVNLGVTSSREMFGGSVGRAGWGASESEDRLLKNEEFVRQPTCFAFNLGPAVYSAG